MATKRYINMSQFIGTAWQMCLLVLRKLHKGIIWGSIVLCGAATLYRYEMAGMPVKIDIAEL